MDDEHELIQGLIERREAAEAEFIARFRPRILRALAELGVPVPDREDVAHDVLVAAWRQLQAGAFQERSRLLTWIQQIVKGKAIDYHRRPDNRRVRVQQDLDDEASPSQERCSLSVDTDPEAVLIARSALVALPLRLRLMFEMRYRHGCEVAEIARVFRISEKRTRNLLTEAKQRFIDVVLGRGTTSRQGRLKGKANA